MAENGWDLHAVVRSCTTATIAGPASNMEDPLPEMDSLTLENDDDPFYFDHHLTTNSDLNPFRGLEEISRDGCASWTLPPATPNPSVPIVDGIPNQKQTQSPQQHIETQLKNCGAGSLPSRRRKHQQIKMVRQMTLEELTADMWAWRKYGQKPIKGTLYPRNYYRCNTSKGCAARKQVERSSFNPDIFVVSYTGKHTHPRSTLHYSLSSNAGNKSSGASDSSSAAILAPSFSSSSTAFAGDDHTYEDVIENTEDQEMAEVEDDDDVLLIPNDVMAEDIFKGFQELKRGK